MSQPAPTEQTELTERIQQLWGHERAVADAAVIDSVSQALARIAALQPMATVQVDTLKASDHDDT